MKLLSGYICISALAYFVGLTNVNAIQLPEGTEDWPARQYSNPKTTTSSGEKFDDDCLSCSHPTLPFGTVIRIQNQRTGRSVDVKVNDRMNEEFKGIRLSKIAASMLGISNSETIPVSATAIGLTTAQLRPAKQDLQQDATMAAFDPSAFDENNRELDMMLQSSPIMVSLTDSSGASEFPSIFSDAPSATPTSAVTNSINTTHGSEHQRVTFSSEQPTINSEPMAVDKPVFPIENLAPLRAQFGAFNNPVKAIELMNELNDQGFETTILSDQQYHVVTKGTFSSQDRASLWIDKVQRLHRREIAHIRL